MSADIGICNQESELQKIVDKLIADNLPVDIDIETGYEGQPAEKRALHPEDAHISGISLTNSTNWARYVPLRHEMAHNLEPEIAGRVLEPLLRTGLTVAHNAKFECRFIRLPVEDGGLGIPLGDSGYPLRSDTIIEEFVLNEEPLIGLKPLSKSRFGYDQAEIMSLFPDVPKNKSFSINFSSLQLTHEVISYCCDDVIWSLRLHQENYDRVKDNLIYKMEMQILPIAIAMEEAGLYYDWDMMKAEAERAHAFGDKFLEELRQDLYELTGESYADFNPGSPKQASALIFGKLGLKTSRMTKGSDTTPPQMSTDEKAMKQLAHQHPVVRKMLDWRQIRKFCGTYLDKYPAAYSYASDGRTHPDMNLIQVKAGRFAVSDPNYQQSPKQYHFELAAGEVYEPEFRKMIKPGPGKKFLYFDYAQQELRIIAGEAGETALLEAFLEDRDPHKETAARMFRLELDDVTKELRDRGKTLNFAISYGQGAEALADDLGVTKSEAQELLNQYFATFKNIRSWIDNQIALGKQEGVVYTKFGRKVTIWEYQSTSNAVYSKGDRMCVNGQCQGGAADYTKTAMIRSTKALTAAGLIDTCTLVMNIHDALCYEIPAESDIFTYIDVLRPAVEFDVPGWPKMVAEWGVGPSWGEIKEVDLVAREEPKFEHVINSAKIVSVSEDGMAFIPMEYVERVRVDDSLAWPKFAEASVEAAKLPEPQYTAPIPIVDLRLSEARQELVLTLPAMPTPEQGQRLVKLIGEGNNSLKLVTPQGFVPFLACALTSDMESVVQMIVPGATLTLAVSDETLDEIAKEAE